MSSFSIAVFLLFLTNQKLLFYEFWINEWKGRYQANCIILDNLFSENFKLAIEPFARTLKIFENCVLVTNNLYGKLVSSSPIIFN